MNLSIQFLPLFFVLPIVVFVGGAEATEKPNVVVILIGDLGSADLGCYGAEDMVTPHLDALADQGLRFTQFYAAAPVCSPSRAALLTDRYPT
jgi:arylsulfatase A